MAQNISLTACCPLFPNKGINWLSWKICRYVVFVIPAQAGIHCTKNLLIIDLNPEWKDLCDGITAGNDSDEIYTVNSRLCGNDGDGGEFMPAGMTNPTRTAG